MDVMVTKSRAILETFRWCYCFKYFDCRVFMKSQLRHEDMSDGVFEIRTRWDGEVGSIRVQYTNVWEEYWSAFRMECRQSISPIAEVENPLPLRRKSKTFG